MAVEFSPWYEGQGEARVDAAVRTLVPPHPNRNAASWANSSPNPSIMPLINGRSKLMAAPRIRDQAVGGVYMTTGEDDDAGEVESSSPEGYCSLSERIVTPDSARGLGDSSDDMAATAESGSRSRQASRVGVGMLSCSLDVW